MKTLMTLLSTFLFAFALSACGGVEPDESELNTYANGAEGASISATAPEAPKEQAPGEADQTEENNEGGGGDHCQGFEGPEAARGVPGFACFSGPGFARRAFFLVFAC